jgi:hypothetical protein
LIFFCSLTFGTGSVHQPVPKDFFYFSFDFSVAISFDFLLIFLLHFEILVKNKGFQ